MKKIYLLILSVLLTTTMYAQTVVKQNKLETTLDKNQESNIIFISELDLSKMSITETGTIILPFMKKNKVMFVSGMDMSYIKERIAYTKKKKFQTTIEVKDIITKTYMITKIEGIETVEEYTERNRELLIAESRKNIQKYPIQVVNQEISNLSTSESSWLPLQIQDKLKSNLQSYLGMKTVVDSKAESALKKLQAESENVGRDENTAIELGKIISAKFALFTKIRKVGANYVIAVDFTDLTTGEQLSSCMSKEYSKAEYLYENTGAVDELTLALSEKLGIKVSDLNKNDLTSGSASFSVDEQLAIAKENEAKFKQWIANYDAEHAKLTTSTDINATDNIKKIEAEKARLQAKQNAQKNRQAELQAQKERVEADKKLEAERSIALKTQRDKLAQDAAAKAAEIRKLKMEKLGVLGKINVVESKKKALVEIRQGVENSSIELFNQMNSDIESEFERITNKTYSTVELGSDGKPTEQALTRRENQKIAKYDELHKKFYADCESVKQATMSQQNALLQEIRQDQTNLAKIKTVNSMGDELKVSFGPYEGSKNGWNAYLSLYSDGILVYTDTVIVSYEAVAGKKAPNMETELNDAVIEEYTNNVDMYNSLLTRGDPILYFVLEYSVNAKSEDNPSEYDFSYKNLKVYNTLSDVVVQNIAINRTEAKVMNPKQDLKIYDGIVEKEKEKVNNEKKYLGLFKIEKILNSKLYMIPYDIFQFVSIPGKNLLMLQTEVTQKLYKIVMGNNPSYFKGDKHPPLTGEIQDKRPVESVSWYDAIYFCNELSVLLGLEPVYSFDGETDVTRWNYNSKTYYFNKTVYSQIIKVDETKNGIRLPTQEEWHYAKRGGEDNKYSDKENLEEVSWLYYGCTHEVAKKKANGYGLYDMFGNVSEWTSSFGYIYNHKEFYAVGSNFSSTGEFFSIKTNEWSRYNTGFRIVFSAENN